VKGNQKIEELRAELKAAGKTMPLKDRQKLRNQISA